MPEVTVVASIMHGCDPENFTSTEPLKYSVSISKLNSSFCLKAVRVSVNSIVFSSTSNFIKNIEPGLCGSPSRMSYPLYPISHSPALLSSVNAAKASSTELSTVIVFE